MHKVYTRCVVARLASYMCLLFEMETYFTVEGMIRGYHVYKDVWNSNIGEMLPCAIERSNRYNPNAIAVMKVIVVGP